MTPAGSPPEGWAASLELGFSHRAGCSHLSRRRRHGPLAVQRSFHPEGPVCHTYILHPPGGVAGGDSLDIQVEVEPGAHALITAPGAAKLYRSDGRPATIHQSLRVRDGATLEWLPQENIFFPGAIVRQQTRVALAASARFIGWEVHCLGRPVIAERFDSGFADLGLALWRDDRPLLLERLRVHGKASLDAAAGLRGHPVTGTLLATGANTGHLSLTREFLSGSPMITAALLDELLVVRYLGDDTHQAWQLLRGLWARLRPTLLGLPACPPRIWAT